VKLYALVVGFFTVQMGKAQMRGGPPTFNSSIAFILHDLSLISNLVGLVKMKSL